MSDKEKEYKRKVLQKKYPFRGWLFSKRDFESRGLTFFIFLILTLFNFGLNIIDSEIRSPLLTVISQFGSLSIFLFTMNFLFNRKKVQFKAFSNDNLKDVLGTSFVFTFNYLFTVIIFSIFGSIFRSPIIGIISMGIYSYLMSLYQNYAIYIELEMKNQKITKSDLREVRLEEILKKK